MFSVQHDDERRQTGRVEECHQEAGPADMDHQRKAHTELPANLITTTTAIISIIIIIMIIVLLSLFFLFRFIFAENEVGACFGSRIW